MLNLALDDVLALPVDQLGIEVLRDMHTTNAWSAHNFIVGEQQRLREVTQRTGGYDRVRLEQADKCLGEALAWLRVRMLIAQGPSQDSSSAIFITRLGHAVLRDGVRLLHATERVQGVHPSIEAVARQQFLLGQFELGVFAALKAVEIRVRQVGGFPPEVIGVDLMNKAFGPGGPLCDPSMAKGEQDGTRALFAGAYGVLRNPSAHREVSYDDVSEAAEAVQTASLLMRMLDRVEKRLKPATT